MEGSKTFSKDFMTRWNIPTAEYRNFKQYDEAKAYIDTVSHRVVLKASGLYVLFRSYLQSARAFSRTRPRLSGHFRIFFLC